MLLAATCSVVFAWWDWEAVGRWVSVHAVVLVLAAGGVLLLGAAGVDLRGGRRRDRSRRPPLSWWAITAGAVAVGVVSWTATVWLLGEADGSVDRASARVNAVKTGLGIGAGTGGVLALLLAVRRQWHQEVSAADTVHDATERRVTELYTKAADQLGSDKAPVRLAGLYALERLAQDNPTQRQTIVNVLCAYLRMPYTPPDEQPPTAEGPEQTAVDKHWERVQEREVRLTAQRLLNTHLQPGPNPQEPAATFWADIDLDLTGATLISFNLADCTIRAAQFFGATFIGTASFVRATFTSTASFVRATFIGTASFVRATFTSTTWFDEATFTSTAQFFRTTFIGDVRFVEATFTDDVRFVETTFTDDASFVGAIFTSTAWFVGAAFIGNVRFVGVTFIGDARFVRATFTGNTRFGRATFTGDVSFDEAALPSTRYVDNTTSSPWTNFEQTRFAKGVPEQVARFVSASDTGSGEDAGAG
uniref:pentapeptide repeat-containing protein n=1 Tax=Actinokineospora sp. CA-119265 TaxID=3239890 RepID=UPI003F499C8B